mmetsp:Transcript_15633/g.25005  ORF Transcript_15633/g.25005 Transcript_15633/m.25005 type:complete len:89 (-) Transcript_15633:727-993(-)
MTLHQRPLKEMDLHAKITECLAAAAAAAAPAGQWYGRAVRTRTPSTVFYTKGSTSRRKSYEMTRRIKLGIDESARWRSTPTQKTVARS